MDGVFVIWDQLLEELAMQQNQFLKILTDEMVAQLVKPQDLLPTDNAYREGVFTWLEHIYTSQVWEKAVNRSRLDNRAIISTCLQNPNGWTLRLASSITQRAGREKIQRVFGPLVAEAMEDLNASRSVP